MTGRRAGALLVTAGAALLVVAGSSYARAALARDAARVQWEEDQARRAADAARRAGDGGAPWPTARGAPVARLVIPRLGLDEIVVAGVGDVELRAGPGHLPGSALPGARGNAIVSAHRDRHFRPLARLASGDTIVTESEAGRVEWVVTGLRVVGAGEPALFDTDAPTLTLTTCWPIRLLGPAPDRLIVTAHRVANARG